MLSTIKGMVRRSLRLETSGYYNLEGERCISYKETLHRLFSRRTRHRNGSICSSIRSSVESLDSNRSYDVHHSNGSDKTNMKTSNNVDNNGSDKTNMNTSNNVISKGSKVHMTNTNTSNNVDSNRSNLHISSPNTKKIDRNRSDLNISSPNTKKVDRNRSDLHISSPNTKNVNSNRSDFRISSTRTCNTTNSNSSLIRGETDSIRHRMLDRGRLLIFERNMERHMERNKTTVIFMFLLSILCSGIIQCWHIATQSNSYHEATPTITNMTIVEEYKNINKQLKCLEMELSKVKQDLNLKFPSGDTLPNVALYSLNARIVHDQTSETYSGTNWLRIWGIPVWKVSRSPNCLIKGNSVLVSGDCWPFEGEQGHVVIQLDNPVNITHVSLGHISKTKSPTLTINSAPKRFTVYGMQTAYDEGTKLGTFLYDEDGDEVQTFKVPDNNSSAFKFVKLQVESNWGDPKYTCLYSFKVHGRLAEQTSLSQ